jgi:putative ABC transport system permease protein
MIRHLFRVVWNRRRANALVLVELTLSFIVLCLVFILAADALVKWLKPLGFDYRDVWCLTLSAPEERLFGNKPPEDEGPWHAFEALRGSLRGLGEVEALTPMFWNNPFTGSFAGNRTYLGGRRVGVRMTDVLPEAMRVMRFRLVAGRWLESGDASLNWTPIVITRSYATALFGDGNPLGRRVRALKKDGTADSDPGGPERRVVGVIEDYRAAGELHGAGPAEFAPLRREEFLSLDGQYLVRLAPGVPAAFEMRLVEAVRAAAPGFNVTVQPLALMRTDALRDALLPLLLTGVLALFTLLMVGLGLAGVLWQNVTRRTRELGLRRALGATAAQVRGQVIGELLAITTVGIGIGAVLYLQLPMLSLFPSTPLAAYLLALAAAVVALVAFAALCALYPGWMATRVRPAEALQHE